MAKKKTQEAGVIIRKAAKVNGKQLSDGIIQAFELKSLDEEEIAKSKKVLADDEQEVNRYQTWETFKQFMSSRTLVLRCLILIFIW